MKHYPKTLTLMDGTTVVARPPTAEDADRSYRFFCALPESHRLYLRMDVTDRELVAARLRPHLDRENKRMFAMLGDEVVGDLALSYPRQGWARQVGTLRVIIASEMQRKGLGSLMALEMLMVAGRLELRKIDASTAIEDAAGLRLLAKLGFREEGVLPKYIMDLKGKRHDMVVMSRSL